jgi:cystathionine beta-lyase
VAENTGWNRRDFLRNTGIAVVAGSVSNAAPASARQRRSDEGYDFDTPLNRFGTDSIKYDRQIRLYGTDSIQVGMGVADMDFRTAPPITKALSDRMQHENWGYLDLPSSFAESIVSWNKRRYGVDVDTDSLVITTGVDAGLVSALKTFSPPGSKVLLNTPTYDGFYSDLSFTGTVPEENPLKVVDGRYSLDFDDFERRISKKTKAFILCNPHNPTGNCWSSADLMRLGEICLRHRVVVLADEIHCDFVTSGNKYTPFASLPNKAVVNNSVTFKSASKSFNLAAMRCAYFYSDNADYVARLKANSRSDVISTMGIIATRAAYTSGESWLNECVAYVDGNHDYVEQFVRTNIPTVKVVKPQGTYLVWIDVSQVSDRINAKQLAAEASRKQPASSKPLTPEQMVERYFVTNARVQMLAGSWCGYGGVSHVRMNVATSRKTLELALTNIASALRTT